MDSDLRDAKPMSNVKGRLEELEQCVLVLEQEPYDPDEAGISDSKAVSVMMNLMRLREWIHAAIPAAWSTVGKLPDTGSKWHTELTQAMRELGMKQSVFNPTTWGPDDEHFADGIRYTIFNNAPSTSFGSLTVLLAPYVRRSIYEGTSVVARLGETEGQQQAKSVRSAKTLKLGWAGKGPVQVMRMQMWADWCRGVL